MLRNRVHEFYIDKDFNCAEATLHAINAEYNLDISEEMMHLVSGFGAGMGCGNACGALCACMSALGKLAVTERAHVTPDFAETCSGLVEKFDQRLGGTTCCQLVDKYRTEETRCMEAVLLAVDTFEEYIASMNLPSARTDG